MTADVPRAEHLMQQAVLLDTFTKGNKEPVAPHPGGCGAHSQPCVEKAGTRVGHGRCGSAETGERVLQGGNSG